MPVRSEVENDPLYLPVLDHGYVVLKEWMGSDQTIVESARVSYGNGTKKVSDDRNLIRYLVRNRHTSPIEMGEVRFLIHMPIFVMRQFVRHRTASLNEYSGRYSVMSNEFYIPDNACILPQSTTNNQGRAGEMSDLEREIVRNTIKRVSTEAYADYEALLEPGDKYNLENPQGLSRELARMVLPVNFYTELYWKCDLKNFLHMVSLRSDSHAQQEIQDYSNAMYSLVKTKFPITCEAFEDYQMFGSHVSRQELSMLKEAIDADKLKLLVQESSLSKREKQEFLIKLGVNNEG